MPIDPNFRRRRVRVGKERGVAIWGPVEPPERLGIRGTKVAVDWDLCTGCGLCLEVCPVRVYALVEAPGRPASGRKPLPARESECACCYVCEARCPARAIRVTFEGSSSPWDAYISLMMTGQIALGPLYGAIAGPYLGLRAPFYVGWLILAVGIPFFLSPLLYFRRRGRPSEDKSLMDTTVLVDSGTYAVVRHPQFLGFLMLMTASILISQHWLSMIVGIPLMTWFYAVEVPKAEERLIVKFGDDYKGYMRRVPRLNPLTGFIRLLRRGEGGSNADEEDGPVESA